MPLFMYIHALLITRKLANSRLWVWQGQQCVQLLQTDEHCCFFFLPFGKCSEGTPHYQCLRCGSIMPAPAAPVAAYPPPGAYPPR